MINFILGLIVGLLLAIICILSIKRFQSIVERTISQVENKIKEKGDIFIEDDGIEDLKAWINKLPKE